VVALLRLLVERAGAPVAKDALMTAAWPLARLFVAAARVRRQAPPEAVRRVRNNLSGQLTSLMGRTVVLDEVTAPSSGLLAANRF
jgi:hypothetical protein